MRILPILIMLFFAVTPATAQRTPDQTQDRMYIGLAKNQAPPVGQIYPWDSGALDTFLDQLRSDLNGKVTDPAIRAMAEDLTLREMREGKTHYYQATFDAFDIYFDGTTQQDRDNALFIFLANAERGDPFAFEGIELFFEEGAGTLPPNVGLHEITRKAADLDLLPAMERLTFYWMYDGVYETPETIEAYLRYAMDIAGEEGFSPIIENVLNFYVHDHNDRPADGYALRALNIYETFESRGWVEDYRSFMYRYGVDLPQDERLQLDAAIRAVVHGNERMPRTVGFMVMNGYGADEDYDLARDVLLDCYKRSQDAYCLSNLGNIYAREENPNENIPLSFALYTRAAELSPAVMAEESGYIAQLDDYMNRREHTLAELYLDQLRNDEFSGLPHLGDARPVDYAALLADRDAE